MCQPNFNISFTARGTLIHQFVASDLDNPNSGIVYSISSYGDKNSEDKFAIDSANGKVTLVKPLDFETLDKHMLTIKATETDTRKAYGMLSI